MGDTSDHDAWAARQMANYVFAPDKEYTAALNKLMRHPHTTWRQTQLATLSLMTEDHIWYNCPIEEQYRQVCARIDDNRREWLDEDESMITFSDQMNVIKLIAMQKTVYPSCIQIEESIFNTPEDWQTTLLIVLAEVRKNEIRLEQQIPLSKTKDSKPGPTPKPSM